MELISNGYCAFELAVFLALCPGTTLTLVPITLYAIEGVTAPIFAVIATTIMASSALELPSAFVSYARGAGFPESVLPAAVVFIVLWPVALPIVTFYVRENYLRERNALSSQLAEFSLANAKCGDERDRAFIDDIVEQVFEHEKAFECEVQQQVKDAITTKFGGSLTLPYWMAVRVVLPIFAAALDVILSLEGTEKLQWQWGVGFGIILVFLQGPLLGWAYIEILASICLERNSRRSEIAVCVVIGAVMAVFCAVLVFFFRWTVGGSAAVQGIMAFVPALGVAFAWRLALLPWGRALLRFVGRESQEASSKSHVLRQRMSQASIDRKTVGSVRSV